MNWLEKDNCPKCEAAPDHLHSPGCDFEVCSCCGQQYVCENQLPLFWAGYHHGTLEAVEQNFFVRLNRTGEGPSWSYDSDIDGNHPDAFPDYNSVMALGKWDPIKLRYIFPGK